MIMEIDMTRLTKYLAETIMSVGIIAGWTVAFTALFAGSPILFVEVIIPFVANTFA
jgi:hypothetical protein